MLSIRKGRWYGWEQLGPGGLDAPWRASPIFVERVTPLKSGAGLLDVDLVIVIRPFQPRRLRARLKIMWRQEHTLIAGWEAPNEPQTLATISEIDRSWVDQHCALIVETHGMPSLVPEPDQKTLTFSHQGETGSVQAYLSHLFGDRPEEMSGGAATAETKSPNVFHANRTGTVNVGWSCRGMLAYLLLKGVTPQQQEDKWYVFREGDRIVFQRNWTNIRIWEAAIEISAHNVTVISLTVNLDRRHYAYDTPDNELARFDRTLKAILWGRESWGYDPEPVEPRRAARAWQALERSS